MQFFVGPDAGDSAVNKAADPLSPQWEACKVCGGDHWTKDHPTTEPGAPDPWGINPEYNRGWADGWREGKAAAARLASRPVPAPEPSARLREALANNDWVFDTLPTEVQEAINEIIGG